MKEKPELLLESWSPLCRMQAFVEQTAANVYFYLWCNPDTPQAEFRACWVCNRQPAPNAMDRESMEQGMAPRMPAAACTHDLAGIELDRDKLSIVWWAEGDAAALLEDGKLLTVIPGWAGADFPGYSRYAAGQSSLAWEMTLAEVPLRQRTEESAVYWEKMQGGYWETFQQSHLAALEEFYGPYEFYYAIDGGYFPPKALVTGHRQQIHYGITIGLSALLQPLIEQYHQDDAPLFHRIELGFACTDAIDDNRWHQMLSYLSAQSNLPWDTLSWLGHGHTIPCDILEGFTAVLLLNSRQLSEIPAPQFPAKAGEPTNLLWLLPITAAEYALTQQEGLEALLDLWRGPQEELVIYHGQPKFIHAQ